MRTVKTIRLVNTHDGQNVISYDPQKGKHKMAEEEYGVFVDRGPGASPELVPWSNILKVWYMPVEPEAEGKKK